MDLILKEIPFGVKWRKEATTFIVLQRLRDQSKNLAIF